MTRVAAVFGVIFFIILANEQRTWAVENQMTADQVLQLVDENLLKQKDSTYSAEVSVIRSNKVVKTMKFDVMVKGVFKKKVTLTAPGDLAGTSIVTTDDNVTYVYMPSYKKVRRVASHVNNQGFLGTDVSGEELGTVALSKGWKGTITRETDASWVLSLVPREGTETTYARMIVTVSKQYGGVEKIESFDKDGKKLKTQVRTEWSTFSDSKGGGKMTIPTVITYTDHLTGSQTKLRILGCKINQDIPESEFTRRSLMRSN